MSKEQIYKWFSVVTQNPMCLNASIRKNIDIIGDAPDEKIWKVLDIVALKEEVLSMPLGWIHLLEKETKYFRWSKTAYCHSKSSA